MFIIQPVQAPSSCLFETVRSAFTGVHKGVEVFVFENPRVRMDGGEHLLTPREREIQADWDREHQLRVKDMHHRAQSALDRRMHVCKKFSELNDRWQGVESRLRTREDQYLQRILHLDRQITLS